MLARRPGHGPRRVSGRDGAGPRPGAERVGCGCRQRVSYRCTQEWMGLHDLPIPTYLYPLRASDPQGLRVAERLDSLAIVRRPASPRQRQTRGRPAPGAASDIRKESSRAVRGSPDTRKQREHRPNRSPHHESPSASSAILATTCRASDPLASVHPRIAAVVSEAGQQASTSSRASRRGCAGHSGFRSPSSPRVSSTSQRRR